MASERYEKLRRTINVLSEQEDTNPETLERLMQEAQELEEDEEVDGEVLPGYTPEDEASWTENQKKFRDDMERNGLNVYQYEGRFFYKGPAVNIRDLQDGIRATSVKIQWDNMGLGWVIYPTH